MPTPNYGLPTYTRSDSSALAAKFNDMMAAVDTALKGVSDIATAAAVAANSVSKVRTTRLQITVADATTWTSDTVLRAPLTVGKWVMDAMIIAQSPDNGTDVNIGMVGASSMDSFGLVGLDVGATSPTGVAVTGYLYSTSGDDALPSDYFISAGTLTGGAYIRLSGAINVTSAGDVGLRFKKRAHVGYQLMIAQGSWIRFTKVV